MPQFRQIAHVVHDAYRAMDEWSRLVGVGPWNVRRLNQTTLDDFEIDGQRVTEDFEYICAVTWAGDVELEIIQPVSGPSIFWGFLEEHGEGLHHIKDVVATEDIPALLEHYAHLGCRVLESGRLETDLHYFLDTQSLLGFVLEIGHPASLGAAPETYPAADTVLESR
jgi:hypothetical protein